MSSNSPLAIFALSAMLGAPEVSDTSGLPPPNVGARWAEAIGLQFLYATTGWRGVWPESAAMLDASLDMQVGPGLGWFQPGQTRLGWKWLAQRHGVKADARITLEQFDGPTEFFQRLDRNGDGVLSAADFDWSFKPPPPMPKGMPPPPGMPTREMFLAGLFNGEVGSPCEGPRVGKRAPRFVLPTHDGRRRIALDNYIGEKPIVLIFGSVT